jgi:hypothetical protein
MFAAALVTLPVPSGKLETVSDWRMCSSRLTIILKRGTVDRNGRVI